MAMTPLCELAMKYGTDKCSKHHYTPVYYELFKDKALDVKTVLEIGIGSNKNDMRKHAASLKMWEEFFPNAQIIGLDKKEHLMIEQGRIKSILANQEDQKSIGDAAKQIGAQLDVVIDDASHRPEHQIKSALTLMPFVADDGIYVIEDIKHEMVFNELRKHYPCDRVHTNSEYADSVLGIIKKWRS